MSELVNLFSGSHLLFYGGLLAFLAVYILLAAVYWRRHTADCDGRGQPWPLTLGPKTCWRPAFCLFTACLALCLVLSLKEEQPKVADSRDLIVILDVSASMLVSETTGTRLAQAKNGINELVSRYQPGAISLILMAGSSFWTMPPSNNLATFSRFLTEASTFSQTDSGSNLAGSLQLLYDKFCPKNKCQLTRDTTVIIASDGEFFDSDYQRLLRKLGNLGLKFVFLMSGSEEGQVPSFDIMGNVNGYRVQLNGQPVISYLQPQKMAELARISGGQFRETARLLPIDFPINPVPPLGKWKFAALLSAFAAALLSLVLRR